MGSLYTLQLFFLMSQSNNEGFERFLITSTILSREIEVITLDTDPSQPNKPIIYFTDGEKVWDKTGEAFFRALVQRKEIPSAVFVFVSTKDPKTGVDNRNEYFFCNESYMQFFEKELIPRVEQNLPGSTHPMNRSLIGISFGGLNAAYFSAKSELFQNFGLLSPVTYPCEDLSTLITFSQREDLRIYLSSGRNDAENYVASLEPLYISKGYQVQSIQTEGGHDFENWKPQMVPMLHFLTKEARIRN
ncbi:MAG: alpha/beta hydrolase-fold protein [Bacteroidota bacterium]